MFDDLIQIFTLPLIVLIILVIIVVFLLPDISKREKAGLIGQAFNSETNQPIGGNFTQLEPINYNWESGNDNIWYSNQSNGVSIEWNGFLKIPTNKSVNFQLISTSNSKMWIGNDNYEVGIETKKYSGNVKIRIRCEYNASGTYVYFKYDDDGGNEMKIVPSEWFITF